MILSVPPSFSTRQGANWVLTAIQVDRQIRLLDQSIEEAETVIALASHPDSQPRRILSYSVTGRWLRPQIESPPQPSDNKPGIHEPPTGELPLPDRSRGKANVTRKPRKGKKRKNVHGQRMLQQPETSAAGGVIHESDPNEPRYCYCNNVSYGAVRAVPLCSTSLKLTKHCRWCNVKIPQNAHAIG
jgi:hypothetical protein